ncbi:hypothetical protein BDR03DRAFT_940319 [Suillus americanus]|nr:hypothetical protein BDR03DRAFT_940319 [Suillus americanus]
MYSLTGRKTTLVIVFLSSCSCSMFGAVRALVWYHTVNATFRNSCSIFWHLLKYGGFNSTHIFIQLLYHTILNC